MNDQPDRPDGDGLRAKLIEFDSFLNEPPPYEDKTMVRDYRHSAYAKWSSLCADIVKLIDSPTEPDDVWEARSERSYIDNTKAPPVRGDREAIARIIDPTAFVTDKLGNWYPESISRRGTAMAKAESILSLRVQPSAGEREAIILECADLAAKFEDCSADYIADKLREFALSRQAPHSSSETES